MGPSLQLSTNKGNSRCHGNEGIRGKAAPANYQVDRTTGSEVMGIFLQTTQLAAVTLISDPLTL